MFWRSKRKDPPAPPPHAPHGGPETGGDPSTEFLTGDSAVDRRTVEVLLGAIARVSESRDLEALLVDIVDRSVELTQAERGFLILVDDQGEHQVRVARSRDGQDVQDDVRFSTSIVRGVHQTGQPRLAQVQSDADALGMGRSVFDLKLRAVMCVPLAAPGGRGDGGAAKGVLYVDSRVATREFSHRDLGLFAALAQHIAIALENARLHLHSVEKARLEQSLELARAIQSGLMPPVPKNLAGVQVHGWFRPAERTSGDFFDFVRTPAEALALVIGDVTGHGAGPALIAASAQASLRSYLKVLPSPAAALGMLNQDLSERMDAGMFLTLLLLILGEDGGVEIYNAGHNGAMLARGGEIHAFEHHGPALGVIPDLEYAVDDRLQLESGDVLLACTDGLLEAHAAQDRGELFGEERVRKLLLELAARGATSEEISLALAEAAMAFSGGKQEDDITLVVVRKL
jgi:serine phosphatase RsbU (regulator of sigma subunit)